MKKPSLNTVISIGLALIAGITAFNDEIEDQKNKKKIEDMDKRIKALEEKGE